MDGIAMNQQENAVIYVRVSTEEQADDAMNLANQEERCRKYCRQQGLVVVEKFVDAGASGRSSERPEFQRMLAYCKNRRNKIRYVIVQDLSRFARNNLDQADAILQLGRSGVALRSAYEGNIDESAGGKLAANIFGSFNQFFSDSHSEKQRDRKRLAVAGGRVPWRAPIGYVNVNAKEGPNIKPHDEYAPMVRRAFQLAATGLHKKTEILKILAKEGFTTPKGHPLTAQTLDKILRNPLYAGWVTLPSDPSVEPARGLHEPLVSQETFDRVQAILHGKKPPVTPRLKSNPEFPLRRIVRCHACGKPLTGAYCTGRSGRYARYWCREKDCRAVSMPKTHLESEFQTFLGRVQVHCEPATDFSKIAARVWQAKQGDSDRELRQLQSQLEEQKKHKAGLLTLRMEQENTRAEFDEANAALRDKISELEEKLKSAVSVRAKAESFVRFAELQLTDLAHVWRIASPEQRERVQNLLFEDGLDYCYESGFLNRSKSSLFSVLESVEFQNTTLVEAAGVEPASEIDVSQESPCSVRFRMFSLQALRTDKMRLKLVR